MDTDRHAPDGDDRHAEPASSLPEVPTSHDESTTAGTPPATDAPPPSPEATAGASHDYGYGEDPLEAAGTGGPRAADSGTAERNIPSALADGAGTGSEPAADAESGTGSEQADDAPAATGVHPATGLRNATAPRAVLRPIPEGFPTPPPRPARPNRRPAPTAEPSETPKRPSGLLIAGISAAVVLLLIVVVGGGLLAVRSFTPPDPGSGTAAEGPDPQTPADPSGPGRVEIGGVVFTEVSTEIGVRAVGASSSRIEPEGEFVVVVFEVENPTSTGVSVSEDHSLITTDGTYSVDGEATDAYRVEESQPNGIVAPDGSGTFHAVFDVPIGSDPTELQFDLVDVDASGALPLTG